MTASAYILGFVRLAALVAPAWVAARAFRSVKAPGWPRPLGYLADLIGTLSVLILVSEVLGSVGLFRWPVVTGTCWLIGGVALWWRRRTETPAPAAPAVARGSRRSGTAAVIVASATGLVCAQWAGWVGLNLDLGVGAAGGPGNGDTLWYHMPFAANFVQSGWTSRLQFTNAEALVTYYPVNTSLLHALGLFSLHYDFLSIFLNLGLVFVALLAGWCVGSERGVGAATLAGVAVALALPAVATAEAGAAKDDVLGLVGLVAAVAFVVHPAANRNAATRRTASWFGGMSAGLALGSKLTLVVPIVALGASLLFLSPKGERRPVIWRWVTAVAATGGYWYLRNLVRMGSPIPGLHLGVGPIQLPRPSTPSMDLYGTNLFHNLTNTVVWKKALLPGLGIGFGDAWPLILIVLAAASILGLLRLRGQDLVPVIVTLCAALAFVITPGTVWGPQFIQNGTAGVTTGLFAFNLRYLLPAVAIGLAIIPIVVSGWRHGRVFVTGFIGVVLLTTQIGVLGRDGWSGGHPLGSIVFGLAAAAVAGTLAWLAAGPGHRKSNLPVAGRVALMAVPVGVAACLWPLQVTYRAGRFSAMPLAQWAAQVAPAKIGYSGFVFSYPLYGPHLENQVSMVGQHGPDGGWHPVSTCPAWQRLIHQDGLQYVLVPVGPPNPIVGIDLARWRLGLPGGSPPDEPPESAWTREAPGVRPVFVGWGVAVYQIGRFTGVSCPKQ